MGALIALAALAFGLCFALLVLFTTSAPLHSILRSRSRRRDRQPSGGRICRYAQRVFDDDDDDDDNRTDDCQGDGIDDIDDIHGDHDDDDDHD